MPDRIREISINTVPAELRVPPQWVVWRREERDGKPTKIPYNARTSERASTTNPDDWSTFPEALTALQSGKFDGIGFVFTNDFTGVDLDNAIDAATSEVKPWAQEIVDELDSYTETSPSGLGLHVITKGRLPTGCSGTQKAYQDGKVEIYSIGRYFTFTGNHLAGTPATVEDRSAEVLNLYREIKPSSTSVQHDEPDSDHALIGQLLRDEKSKRLWDGDDSDYDGDASRGDQALACKLANLTDSDPDRMERFFSQSKRGQRDKWTSREDYRRRTIEKAIQFRKETGLLAYPFNDYGNALRLILRSGDVIRYCHDLKKWLVFDGKRWAVDAREQVKHLAMLMLVDFLQQAVKAGNSDAEKYAKSCLRNHACNELMSMARPMPKLAITSSELDQHPFLLNCLNGTVDLQTGDLHPHDSKLFITKLVGHDYRPESKCPVWHGFLNQIMGGKKSLMEFLQRALGYSLTGNTIEKVVFFCYGDGNNGKSTMLAAFRFVIREYSGQIQASSLMSTRNGPSNNSQSDTADLFGTRFAVTNETEEGQKFNEAHIKYLTQGMGTIKAFRKYENGFVFEPTFKLWVDGNHRPEITGTDSAIWNRQCLIPFTVTIPKDKQDQGLLIKLQSEAEGILAWAVHGAWLWWVLGGLNRPPEVMGAVEDWRKASDPFPIFIAEVCQMAGSCAVSDLRNEYYAWCSDNEHEPLDAAKFNSRLESQGCRQVRSKNKITKKQFRAWNGIQIAGDR